MNYRGLKQASRQCLLDSGISPRRLTLLFLLCFYAVSIPCDVLSLFLEEQLNQATGLAAAAHRNRYYLWVSTITVVINVALVLWNAGYTMFTLHLSRGQHAGFPDFLTGFRLVGKVLTLTLLEVLFVWLWALLLLFPGIVAAYRYRMALYALLDDPSLSASEALQVSKRLTYGHKLELFFLDLSFIWYYLLGFLTDIPMMLYNWGWPSLHGWMEFLAAYLGCITLNVAVNALFQAQIQTTYAHAYNWLVSLDQARRNDAQWHSDTFHGSAER